MARPKSKSKSKSNAKPKSKAKSKPNAPDDPAARRVVIAERVCLMFASVYGLSGAAALRTDPNDLAQDPGPFYQAILDTFDLAPPAKKSAAFSGLAGTVATLIDTIHARWRPPYHLPPFGPL